MLFYSGCVTSAEAVLIQEQSYHKLVDILDERAQMVVVTLSPQSVASIASFVKIPTYLVFLKLAAFLKSLGVRYVFDASAGGDIALLEAREEFITRYV
jgi:iron only hydrogenase large subunit-like protein